MKKEDMIEEITKKVIADIVVDRSSQSLRDLLETLRVAQLSLIIKEMGIK